MNYGEITADELMDGQVGSKVEKQAKGEMKWGQRRLLQICMTKYAIEKDGV